MADNGFFESLMELSTRLVGRSAESYAGLLASLANVPAFLTSTAKSITGTAVAPTPIGKGLQRLPESVASAFGIRPQAQTTDEAEMARQAIESIVGDPLNILGIAAGTKLIHGFRPFRTPGTRHDPEALIGITSVPQSYSREEPYGVLSYSSRLRPFIPDEFGVTGPGGVPAVYLTRVAPYTLRGPTPEFAVPVWQLSRLKTRDWAKTGAPTKPRGLETRQVHTVERLGVKAPIVRLLGARTTDPHAIRGIINRNPSLQAYLKWANLWDEVNDKLAEAIAARRRFPMQWLLREVAARHQPVHVISHASAWGYVPGMHFDIAALGGMTFYPIDPRMSIWVSPGTPFFRRPRTPRGLIPSATMTADIARNDAIVRLYKDFGVPPMAYTDERVFVVPDKRIVRSLVARAPQFGTFPWPDLGGQSEGKAPWLIAGAPLPDVSDEYLRSAYWEGRMWRPELLFIQQAPVVLSWPEVKSLSEKGTAEALRRAQLPHAAGFWQVNAPADEYAQHPDFQAARRIAIGPRALIRVQVGDAPSSPSFAIPQRPRIIDQSHIQGIASPAELAYAAEKHTTERTHYAHAAAPGRRETHGGNPLYPRRGMYITHGHYASSVVVPGGLEAAERFDDVRAAIGGDDRWLRVVQQHVRLKMAGRDTRDLHAPGVPAELQKEAANLENEAYRALKSAGAAPALVVEEVQADLQQSLKRTLKRSPAKGRAVYETLKQLEKAAEPVTKEASKIAGFVSQQARLILEALNKIPPATDEVYLPQLKRFWELVIHPRIGIARMLTEPVGWFSDVARLPRAIALYVARATGESPDDVMNRMMSSSLAPGAVFSAVADWRLHPDPEVFPPTTPLTITHEVVHSGVLDEVEPGRWLFSPGVPGVSREKVIEKSKAMLQATILQAADIDSFSALIDKWAQFAIAGSDSEVHIPGEAARLLAFMVARKAQNPGIERDIRQAAVTRFMDAVEQGLLDRKKIIQYFNKHVSAAADAMTLLWQPWGVDFRDFLIRDAILKAHELGHQKVAFPASSLVVSKWRRKGIYGWVNPDKGIVEPTPYSPLTERVGHFRTWGQFADLRMLRAGTALMAPIVAASTYPEKIWVSFKPVTFPNTNKIVLAPVAWAKRRFWHDHEVPAYPYPGAAAEAIAETVRQRGIEINLEEPIMHQIWDVRGASPIVPDRPEILNAVATTFTSDFFPMNPEGLPLVVDALTYPQINWSAGLLAKLRSIVAAASEEELLGGRLFELHLSDPSDWVYLSPRSRTLAQIPTNANAVIRRGPELAQHAPSSAELERVSLRKIGDMDVVWSLAESKAEPFSILYDDLLLGRLQALANAAGAVIRPAFVVHNWFRNEHARHTYSGGVYTIDITPELLDAARIAAADDTREERGAEVA